MFRRKIGEYCNIIKHDNIILNDDGNHVLNKNS